MAMRRLSGDVGEASPPWAPRSDNAGSVEDVIGAGYDCHPRSNSLRSSSLACSSTCDPNAWPVIRGKVSAGGRACRQFKAVIADRGGGRRCWGSGRTSNRHDGDTFASQRTS